MIDLTKFENDIYDKDCYIIRHSNRSEWLFATPNYTYHGIWYEGKHNNLKTYANEGILLRFICDIYNLCGDGITD